MTKRVLILDGPGAENLEDRKRLSEAACQAHGIELSFEQSDNDEWIETQILSFGAQFDALIFNPCTAATTSMDTYRRAITAAARGQIIEIRDNNIFKTDNAQLLQQRGDQIGLICGFGNDGYTLAISALAEPARSNTNPKGEAKIRIINGPNLNLLGTREPEIYGHRTLDDIKELSIATGEKIGADVEFLQSNHEGEIVDWIQSSIGEMYGIIINAAAYTHTSIAIHDALKAYTGVKIELHISNPHARESFRHHSFVSSAVDGVIAGLGANGYQLALSAMAAKLK